MTSNPTANKTTRMQLRLTAADHETITSLADKMGLSKNQIVELAVRLAGVIYNDPNLRTIKTELLPKEQMVLDGQMQATTSNALRYAFWSTVKTAHEKDQGDDVTKPFWTLGPRQTAPKM